MKPARRYIDFLQDIVDNLEKTEKTRYSLICALEIVGEAAKKEFAPQIRSEIETILSFERSKEERKE